MAAHVTIAIRVRWSTVASYSARLTAFFLGDSCLAIRVFFAIARFEYQVDRGRWRVLDMPEYVCEDDDDGGIFDRIHAYYQQHAPSAVLQVKRNGAHATH